MSSQSFQRLKSSILFMTGQKSEAQTLRFAELKSAIGKIIFAEGLL
jgi:hypothetical protein